MHCHRRVSRLCRTVPTFVRGLCIEAYATAQILWGILWGEPFNTPTIAGNSDRLVYIQLIHYEQFIVNVRNTEQPTPSDS